MFAIVPLIEALIRVTPKLITAFKNLSSGASKVISQTAVKSGKSISKSIKKRKDGFVEGAKDLGISAGGGIIGTGVVKSLEDNDDAGLSLLANVDKNIAEINAKIKPVPEVDLDTSSTRTDISAEMARLDAEEIRNSHSKDVKEAIKAIQDLKKPLEDLVRVMLLFRVVRLSSLSS